MITTIILSKDRPAQLDLLLRSLEKQGEGWFDPEIIVAGTAPFDNGYKRVIDYHGGPIEARYWWWPEKGQGKDPRCTFEFFVKACIDTAKELLCFMCDDGIFYRLPPWNPEVCFNHPEYLSYSLRLGENTTVCYPSGLTQKPPAANKWRWVDEPQDPGVSDFGYPGSIDGHVFRTADVRRMLEGRSFPNPTALECALAEGCRELASERPLMACYPRSVYVGNPINRVSEQSNVRFGTRFPVTAEECRERFLRGERIDLDALDFSGVNGAHTEIELVWSKPTAES